MTPIVFDNIVFALQRFGGVSMVWGELLRRAINDPDLSLTILDYVCTNNVRSDLHIPSACLIHKDYRTLERYRTPDWQPTAPTIFHSSYFRIHPHPMVSNVTTVHDLTYHFYRRGLAKGVHLWEEARALRHSAAVICVSENTRQDLLTIYPHIDAQKVHVVYNGVSDAFYPDASIEKKGYLLYVGNRSVDYKRFDVAVEVARITGLELVAIGGALTKEEKQWLDNTIPNRYRVVSGLSTEQFNAYYNEALCLLYPSDYEGFGLPVVEAQKAGCPVVAQRTSSIPEVIGDGWMAEAHSPSMAQQMADYVQSLLSQSTQSIVEKGIENATRFSWDKTYQQTKQIYDQLENK